MSALLENWLAQIERLHPNSIDLGLERVTKVAQKLDVARFNCPIVTVGGTNGKGSCVKFIEEILTFNHHRVGAYSSPHLLRFNERIRIGNAPVTDQQLIEAFEQVESARADVSLTFFEFTTLAAFWLFHQAQLDVLILEVGLGGRLDAVNLLDADIGVITTIDFDHQEWLGHTLEEIGFEKAGIFKKNKIAICGDPTPPTSLLRQANHMASQLFCRQKDFTFVTHHDEWQWHSLTKSYHHLPLPSLPLESAAAALMAVTQLDTQFGIGCSDVHSGIGSACLAGRFQKMPNPSCILDVAHNPAAARMLAQKLTTEEGSFCAVVGMLADKDIKNTLAPLVPRIKEWYVGSLDVPRGAPAHQLTTCLKEFEGVQWYSYDNVSAAFQAAASSLKPDDRIVVFGSFYTVAEILNLLE